MYSYAKLNIFIKYKRDCQNILPLNAGSSSHDFLYYTADNTPLPYEESP